MRNSQSGGTIIRYARVLTYGTTVRLTIRLQAAQPERTGQLYFLGWTLPPVLAKKLHISNHLALRVYDPLSPKNTSLIQTVTQVSCHLAMNASKRPRPPQNPNAIPLAFSNSLYCHASFSHRPLLAAFLMAVFVLTPIFFYVYVYINLCK